MHLIPTLYLICISFLLTTPSLAEHATRLLLTDTEMQQLGISLRILPSSNSEDPPPSDSFNREVPGFPNKCFYNEYYLLTISDKMLGHFQARGFTLPSLCLAIQGYSKYDIETGKPLPVAIPAIIRDGQKVALRGDIGILLNVPDCYKNGLPYVDCKQKYNNVYGEPELLSKDTTGEFEKMLEVAKQQFRSVCTCKSIRVQHKYFEQISSSRPCRIDVLSVCEAKKIRSEGIEGFLLGEPGFREAAKVSSTLYYQYEVNPVLTKGFGYMLGGPEGDDPETDNEELETAVKQAGTSAPWLGKE